MVQRAAATNSDKLTPPFCHGFYHARDNACCKKQFFPTSRYSLFSPVAKIQDRSERIDEINSSVEVSPGTPPENFPQIKYPVF